MRERSIANGSAPSSLSICRATHRNSVQIKTRNIRIGDRRFSIMSDDSYLDRIRGGFEPHMLALFKTLVPPDGVVLDIGANIGCTTLWFAGHAMAVYSFEPSPSTITFHTQNVSHVQF